MSTLCPFTLSVCRCFLHHLPIHIVACCLLLLLLPLLLLLVHRCSWGSCQHFENLSSRRFRCLLFCSRDAHGASLDDFGSGSAPYHYDSLMRVKRCSVERWVLLVWKHRRAGRGQRSRLSNFNVLPRPTVRRAGDGDAFGMGAGGSLDGGPGLRLWFPCIRLLLLHLWFGGKGWLCTSCWLFGLFGHFAYGDHTFLGWVCRLCMATNSMCWKTCVRMCVRVKNNAVLFNLLMNIGFW